MTRGQTHGAVLTGLGGEGERFGSEPGWGQGVRLLLIVIITVTVTGEARHAQQRGAAEGAGTKHTRHHAFGRWLCRPALPSAVSDPSPA